jgi:S1-C subfamily serine protease
MTMAQQRSEAMEAAWAASEGLADAVERAAAATVLVDARRRLPASGVVWPVATAAGAGGSVVVTADHVLERDEEIAVGLPDGSESAATLVGRDPRSDLAVLRVEAELAPAELAPAGESRVGQLVIAVGRPFPGGAQASAGLLSAVGVQPFGRVRMRRAWGGADEHGRGRGRHRVAVRREPAAGGLGYLRPELTFYPGFSGGPLADARGRVIGVNSSHLARGAGLAIPAAAVTPIVNALLTTGRVARAYIGIASQPTALPEALAEKVGGQAVGLLIVGAEAETPAGAAGVLVGDILVAITGEPVGGAEELAAQLGPERVGQEVTLTLLRGGEPYELPLTLGERE